MTELLGVIVILFAVNVLFVVVVIFLRIRSNYRARRLTQIESVWDPVIVGVVISDDQDVPPIPENEARHVLEIAGRFARRLRGPDREKVQKFAAPIVGLLEERLTSGSQDSRAAAVELLGLLAPNSYSASIVAALNDPSPRVSLVAARALLHPDTTNHTPAVLRQLHRYSTWSPSLVSSMLEQAGSGALPDLRRYLGDAKNATWARAVVAGALQRLSDPQSAAVAADALESDDPELAVACLRLIGTVGSSLQADAVRRLAQHPVFFVRSETAAVLGHIGDDSDIEAIASMAGSDVPWESIHAVRALLDLGQHSMLEGLSAGHGQGADSAREALQEVGMT